jgi:hypothetical protein
MMKSILILMSLSLTLVGCQSDFAGQGDSAFFKVEKSSSVGDPLMAEPTGEEPEGEEPAGEDPREDDDVIVILDDGGGAPSPSSVPDVPKDGSSSVVSSPVTPMEPSSPGSSSSGSESVAPSGAGASQPPSSPAGSGSGGVVSNPCESASDGQSCMDLKCEPVTENEKYVTCVPPGTPGKPVVPVSSVKKDCSNLPKAATVPGKTKKAIVCHQRGNGGYHTIVIACPALKSHIDHHNDTVGVCLANQ